MKRKIKSKSKSKKMNNVNIYNTKTVTQGRLEKVNIGVKLIIPSQIIEEINHYHRNAPGKEWGGPVFYDVLSGSFEEGDLILKVTQMFIGDVGTAAHTEYDFDELNKIDECYELLTTSKWGGHHTHHNMATFFSGEDRATLLEKSVNYVGEDQYYLSLIVNCQDYTHWKARICKRVQSKKTVTKEVTKIVTEETVSESYKWWNNILPTATKTTPEEKTEVTVETDQEVFIYDDCEITVEQVELDYRQLYVRANEFLKMRDTIRHNNNQFNNGYRGVGNNFHGGYSSTSGGIGFQSSGTSYNRTDGKVWIDSKKGYDYTDRVKEIIGDREASTTMKSGYSWNQSVGLFVEKMDTYNARVSKDTDDIDMATYLEGKYDHLMITDEDDNELDIDYPHDICKNSDIERMLLNINSFNTQLGHFAKGPTDEIIEKHVGRICQWLKNMITNRTADFDYHDLRRLFSEIACYEPKNRSSQNILNNFLKNLVQLEDKGYFTKYFQLKKEFSHI